MGSGWDRRVKNPTKFNIILHTTNGRKGSRFASELKFLLTSFNVSAHYLVGKDGYIVELLPIDLRAWHVGVVDLPENNNNNTIGIEMHYTLGEKTSQAQKNATKDLIRDIQRRTLVTDIRMHRTVARPTGRKIDPSNFTNTEFAIWREEVLAIKVKKLIRAESTVYTSPDYDHPIASHITDERIKNGIVIHDYVTEVMRVSDRWYWITSGIGFVESTNVE